MMKKKKGFTSYELLLVMTVLTVLFLITASITKKLRIKAEAEVVRSRVVYVIDQLQRYYMDQIVAGVLPTDLTTYPSSMIELESSGDYIESCAPADVSANRCFDYKYLPIGTVANNSTGEPIELNRITGAQNYPEIELSFSLAGVTNNDKFNALFSELQTIPSFTMDANEKVTYTITRPANAVHLENLVKRDGSTTLTGDSWDTGGVTWLTNVRGLFLKNQDGSQYSVASGLSQIAVAQDGDTFPLHSCPEGHTPDLDVMVKSIQATDYSNKYAEVSAFLPRYSLIDNTWHVYLDYYAKRKSDDQWVTMNDGYLKVTFLCKIS